MDIKTAQPRAGEVWSTRSGGQVRIIAVDMQLTQPVIGVGLEDDQSGEWHLNGRYSTVADGAESRLDLVARISEAPDPVEHVAGKYATVISAAVDVISYATIERGQTMFRVPPVHMSDLSKALTAAGVTTKDFPPIHESVRDAKGVRDLIGSLRYVAGLECLSIRNADQVTKAADLLERALDEAPKLAAIRAQVEGGAFFPVEASIEQRCKMAARLLEGTGCWVTNNPANQAHTITIRKAYERAPDISIATAAAFLERYADHNLAMPENIAAMNDAARHLRNYERIIRERDAGEIAARADSDSELSGKITAFTASATATDAPPGVVAAADITSGPHYVLWSNKHECWWRPDRAGYTRILAEAGLYARDEAFSISNAAGRWAGGIPSCVPMRADDAAIWFRGKGE